MVFVTPMRPYAEQLAPPSSEPPRPAKKSELPLPGEKVPQRQSVKTLSSQLSKYRSKVSTGLPLLPMPSSPGLPRPLYILLYMMS